MNVLPKNLSGWLPNTVISSDSVKQEFQNIYAAFASNIGDENIAAISMSKITDLPATLNLKLNVTQFTWANLQSKPQLLTQTAGSITGSSLSATGPRALGMTPAFTSPVLTTINHTIGSTNYNVQLTVVRNSGFWPTLLSKSNTSFVVSFNNRTAGYTPIAGDTAPDFDFLITETA